MALHIETFILGPLENNTYLITKDNSGAAAIVDPSIPSREILDALRKNDLKLEYILITHAHFDHIGGAEWLKHQFTNAPQIVLHRADLDLWQSGGGAKDFGFAFDAGAEPDWIIEKDQTIPFNGSDIQILFTPGHTSGHLTYYFPEGQAAFCGDLIFYHGIGRTDLRTSDEADLYQSIEQKIFTLPDQIVLYPGHGPSTTVKEERENNPFLA